MSTISQRNFMNSGGIYAGILQAKYEKGELTPPDKYSFQEYPKMIRIFRGKEMREFHTVMVRGKDEVPHTYEKEVELYDEHVVYSEAEE